MKWALYIGIAIAGLIALVVIIGALLPKAHVASRSARYKQPASRIFEVISGPPDWRPDVKSFEMLPAKGGNAMWREMDSHGQAITFERTEFHPPSRMLTRIADPNLPFGGYWTYEVTDAPGGATLRVTEHGEVYNPVFRFVSKFIMGHHGSLEKYLQALGSKLGDSIQVEP